MKTFFVTGGARGIGAAVVRAAAENGYNVVVGYRGSEAAAKLLERELGVYAVYCDVRDRNSVFDAYAKAKSRFGRIDVLVTSAGIAQQKLYTDLTVEDWKNMFDTNLFGTVNAIDAVLPDMISAKRGSIVTVSSMWGEVGGSCEVHYSASKAAVIGLTKALAKEVGLSGVTVNCVSPGVILTDMTKSFSEDDLRALEEETPLARIGTAKDVAKAIMYLADCDGFVTGEVLRVNGGFVI